LQAVVAVVVLVIISPKTTPEVAEEKMEDEEME
jgi:hypothetical protein